MRDCANVTMREQLPDLLHDRLSASAREDLERHVATCANCAAELDLLREVRAAAVAPPVDVGRIVAALPPRGQPAAWWRSGRLARLAAAAVVLGAVGSIVRWSYAPRHDVAAPAGRVVESSRPGGAPAPAANPALPQASATSADPMRGADRVAARPALSLGEPLVDLSDSDLRALVEAADDLDPVMSTQTDTHFSFMEGAS